MSWYSAWFFCCCESLSPRKSSQESSNPTSSQSIIAWKIAKILPNCSLWGQRLADDEGRPSPWMGVLLGFGQILMNPVIGIVFKLNVELDVPTLNQISPSFFLEENSCCFWVGSYLSFCAAGAWKITIWYVLFDFQGIMSCWTTVQEDCLSWYWKMLYLARVFLPSKG